MNQSYSPSTNHPCHYLPTPLDACCLELAQDGLHARTIRVQPPTPCSAWFAPSFTDWPWSLLPTGSRAGGSIAADDEVKSSALVSTRSSGSTRGCGMTSCERTPPEIYARETHKRILGPLQRVPNREEGGWWVRVLGIYGWEGGDESER